MTVRLGINPITWTNDAGAYGYQIGFTPTCSAS